MVNSKRGRSNLYLQSAKALMCPSDQKGKHETVTGRICQGAPTLLGVKPDLPCHAPDRASLGERELTGSYSR